MKSWWAGLHATDLTDAEAISLAARVLDWYKQADKKKRLGRIIDDFGLATIKAELGLPGE